MKFSFDKIEPVLAPKKLTVNDITGRAKNRLVDGLLGIRIVLRLYGCAF